MNQKVRTFNRWLFLAYVACSLAAIFYLPTLVQTAPASRPHITLDTTIKLASCSSFCWWQLVRYGTKGLNLQLCTPGDLNLFF